jgi:hypothetical protein
MTHSTKECHGDRGLRHAVISSALDTVDGAIAVLMDEALQSISQKISLSAIVATVTKDRSLGLCGHDMTAAMAAVTAYLAAAMAQRAAYIAGSTALHFCDDEALKVVDPLSKRKAADFSEVLAAMMEQAVHAGAQAARDATDEAIKAEPGGVDSIGELLTRHPVLGTNKKGATIDADSMKRELLAHTDMLFHDVAPHGATSCKG